MPSCRSKVALLATLLVLLGPALAAAQESVTVLRGSGPNETSALVLQVLNTVRDRAGRPTEFLYRTLPVATASSNTTGSGVAQSDFIDYSTKVDFAVGSEPLSSSQWTGLGNGNVMQVPFGMFTISIYYNIPGTNTAPVNLTACMIQKLLTGAITTWSPSLTQGNPTLGISDQTIAVNVFMDAANAPSTRVLLAYLAAASCPVSSVSSMTATYSSDVAMSVMKTSYSLGYALTSKGRAYGLKEAAIENRNGDFVTSTSFNLTNTQVAVAAVMPASFTADFSAVTPVFLAGAKVYPALAVSYMYLRPNQSTSGDKGALLQALISFMLSAEAQSFSSAAGMLAIGSTAKALTAVTTGFTLNAPAYTLEPLGTVSATGQDLSTISATRISYERQLLQRLQTDVAEMKATMAQAVPKLLRGSGSSAASLVLWRAMDALSSMATTPIWTSYRAIGSGGGESEIAGSPIGGPAFVDFGCSDVPMTKSVFDSLASVGVKVVHIPLFISPISLFINIPTSALPTQRLRLSACAIAGIFQGTIRTWDDPAIALDNPDAKLPAQPITPVYRSGSSGTNAVFSQYFATVCPDWKLGSGRSLPASGATGTFSTAAVGVGSSLEVTTYIKTRPWSIGYADTGNGVSSSLVEVYLKNKAGAWVTAQTADLSAAASQLFQSGGWPSSPTADFSGVSLLDQPGDRTWPITSIPFIMVRLDLTTRGSSGPLLAAFLSYLLTPAAQAVLPVMGFSPLPSDVVTYTTQRALPLLSTDKRFSTWFFESSSGSRYTGASDSVFSGAKETYIALSTNQLMNAFLTASAASTSTSGSNTTTNNTSTLNLTSIAGLSGLGDKINDTNEQVDILQSMSIAALIFGMAALCLAIFAACKLFIVGVLAHKNQVTTTRGSLTNKGAKGSEDMSVTLMPSPSNV